MGLLDGIFGGVSSLAGLLGAQSAARSAQAQRQAIIDKMLSEAEGNYLSDLGQNSRTLYSEAGSGGDAIRALGSNLGSSLAGAGVYNPSAVGGALALGQRDQNSAIAKLAAQLQADAAHRRQQAIGQARGLQLGVANSQADQAQADLGTARGGLSSFLGSLVQNNLLRSGANVGRVSIPPVVNGTVNQGANLPGNAGLQSGTDWRKLLDLRTPIVGNYGAALGGSRY